MNSKRVLVRMLLILGMISTPLLAGCAGNATSQAKPPAPSPTPNPTPAIATLSPASAQAGSASFTLTVNGTNFISASVINFGGTTLATTFVNATQLTAAIPALDVALAGTVAVTVTNPAPGGGTSNGANFTITTGIDAAPMVFSNGLDPSCAPVAGGDFTLLLFGTNFASDSVVQWNGTNLPTTVEAGINGPELFAQVPGSDIAAAGTAAVTVFNPAPGGGTSNAVNFTISAGGISPQSISVDPTGKFAYTANNGCADAFTGNVSMYIIDTTTGRLSLIGPPADTGDFDPLSVAIDPSSKFVYVASWGGGDSAGSLAMYTINATSGTLTSTGFIDGVCPGLCAPWSVAVHPSGKFAYVGDEGGFAPTGVSMFAIDGTTGSLSSIGTVVAGGRVNSVAVDLMGKFVYATDDSFNDVSMFTVNGTTGILTFIDTIAAGTDPVSVAVDPSGKFVYVANSRSNDVSMYTVNSTTGALTSTGAIAAGTSPVSVAVDPTGKFAYVVNSGSSDVSVYSIDGTTGALTLVGTVAAELSPTAIAIHPSGKFAYVTNSGSNSISMYSIDASTGALVLIGTIGT